MREDQKRFGKAAFCQYALPRLEKLEVQVCQEKLKLLNTLKSTQEYQRDKLKQQIIPVSKMNQNVQMKVHSPKDFHDDDIMILPSPSDHNHNGEIAEMFKCRHCPMMSKKKANVKIHERKHGQSQSSGKLLCNFCSYASTGQGGLTNHKKMYHSGEQDQTSSFNDMDSVPTPKRRAGSYFCMRCPAFFKSSSNLFIHETCHGFSLPLSCPHCDYCAKHKMQLQNHLQVHKDAYVAKRNASFGPPLDNENDQDSQRSSSGAKSVNSPQSSTENFDQMLLLELAEVETFLRNSKIKGRRQKCGFCPATFANKSVLVYHVSLHGSSGEFSCSQCDYATTHSPNLASHVQVHGKITSPTKKMSRVFSCPNCPTIFNKRAMFERHLNLHGQKYRFSCEHCDYSVNCAANLTKHKAVHEKAEPAIASGSDAKLDISSAVIPTDSIAGTSELFIEPDSVSKEKPVSSPDTEDKAYLCERCPYFQMRKDAVIKHQDRHGQKEGIQCPYCDYKVIGQTFLRNHVKSHITPTNVFSAQIYAKFNRFNISYVDVDGNKITVFEDKGAEVDLRERFFPPLEDDILIVPPVENSDHDMDID